MWKKLNKIQFKTTSGPGPKQRHISWWFSFPTFTYVLLTLLTYSNKMQVIIMATYSLHTSNIGNIMARSRIEWMLYELTNTKPFINTFAMLQFVDTALNLNAEQQTLVKNSLAQKTFFLEHLLLPLLSWGPSYSELVVLLVHWFGIQTLYLEHNVFSCRDVNLPKIFMFF